jgi:hypothetical protein
MVCFEDTGGYLRTIGLSVASFGYLVAPLLASQWWYSVVISPSIASFIYFFLMAWAPETFTAEPEKMVGWIALFSVALVMMIGAMARYATMTILITATGIPLYNNSALVGNWLSTNISPHLSIMTGGVIILLIIGAIGGLLSYYGVLSTTMTAMDMILKVVIASVILAFYIDVALLERHGDRLLCFGWQAEDPSQRSPLAFDRPATFSMLAGCMLLLSVMVYQVHKRGFCPDARSLPIGCCRRKQPDAEPSPEPEEGNVAEDADASTIVMVPVVRRTKKKKKKNRSKKQKRHPLVKYDTAITSDLEDEIEGEYAQVEFYSSSDESVQY